MPKAPGSGLFNDRRLRMKGPGGGGGNKGGGAPDPSGPLAAAKASQGA
jgi:hypothetical protein